MHQPSSLWQKFLQPQDQTCKQNKQTTKNQTWQFWATSLLPYLLEDPTINWVNHQALPDPRCIFCTCTWCSSNISNLSSAILRALKWHGLAGPDAPPHRIYGLNEKTTIEVNNKWQLGKVARMLVFISEIRCLWNSQKPMVSCCQMNLVDSFPTDSQWTTFWDPYRYDHLPMWHCQLTPPKTNMEPRSKAFLQMIFLFISGWFSGSSR